MRLPHSRSAKCGKNHNDIETIARKVDALESKVSELEKLHVPRITDANTKKIKDALKKYLKSSSEIKTLWKGNLSAVEEARAMRRHVKVIHL